MIWDLLQWLVYIWLGGVLAFVAWALAVMAADPLLRRRVRWQRRELHRERGGTHG